MYIRLCCAALIRSDGIDAAAELAHNSYSVALAPVGEADSVDRLFAMRTHRFDDLGGFRYLFELNRHCRSLIAILRSYTRFTRTYPLLEVFPKPLMGSPLLFCELGTRRFGFGCGRRDRTADLSGMSRPCYLCTIPLWSGA